MYWEDSCCGKGGGVCVSVMRRHGAFLVTVLVLLVLATSAQADLWPVLDAHWKLDETDTGSTVVDDARGGIAGERVGNVGIGVTGVDGTAYSYPGEQTAYVDLKRKDVLPESGPFKLELWINKPSSDAGNDIQYILSNMIGGEAGRTIVYEQNGRVILGNAGTNMLFMDTDLLPTVRDNQWHKITMTRQPYDDTLDLFELYMNDVLHDSQTYSTSRVFQSAGTPDWQLGGPRGVSGRAYKGLIDGVRVYVPEPSSIALLLMAAAMLLLRRRRA
jgi:hypothetical protein